MQRADEGVPLVEPQQDVHAPLQLRVPHVKSRHAEKVRWVSVTLANIFFHFHKKLVVDGNRTRVLLKLSHARLPTWLGNVHILNEQRTFLRNLMSA